MSNLLKLKFTDIYPELKGLIKFALIGFALIFLFLYWLIYGLMTPFCKYSEIEINIPQEISDIVLSINSDDIYTSSKPLKKSVECTKSTKKIFKRMVLADWGADSIRKGVGSGVILDKDEHFTIEGVLYLKCDGGLRCIDSGDIGYILVLKDQNDELYYFNARYLNAIFDDEKYAFTYSKDGEERGLFSKELLGIERYK